MTTFEQVAAKSRKPGKTLLLEPWVFSDEWSKKPNAPVCVGLRLLADSAKTKARMTGEELADQVHPQRGDNWIDTFNDATIRQVVALALCDPNSVDQPFELMLYPESDVSDALTSRGALFIFEQLDWYEQAASPIGIPAGAPELDRLTALLPKLQIERVPLGTRRMLTAVIDELDDLFGDELVEPASVDHPGDEILAVVSK